MLSNDCLKIYIAALLFMMSCVCLNDYAIKVTCNDISLFHKHIEIFSMFEYTGRLLRSASIRET